MADLAQWLGAQLDADKRIALKSVEQAIVNLAGADAASVADWHVVERPATGTFVATRDQWDRVTEIVPTYGGAHSEHIAEHDPARVLREIEAKREALDEHQPDAFGDCTTCAQPEDFDEDADGNRTWSRTAKPFPCPTLRLLASVYDDRPGYQEGWAP